MSQLKGARTEKCLKDAFAIESQVKLRYTYFANKADLEGKAMWRPCFVRRPKAKTAKPKSAREESFERLGGLRAANSKRHPLAR